MTLALLNVGESGVVKALRGKEEVVHHLQNFGFASGAEVSVVGQSGSGMILAVKGSRIALNRGLASRIVLA